MASGARHDSGAEPSAARPELVLCASAVGSPPWPVLVNAASAGGFASLSLWPADTYGRALEAGLSIDDLRSLLVEYQLAVFDVDAVVSWVGDDDPGPPYLSEAPASYVLEAGAALGARYTNALVLGPRGTPPEVTATAVAKLAERAASHGMGLMIEFGRGTAARDVVTAVEIVQLTGRPDVGLNVDTWHLHWSSTPLSDVVAMPPGIVRQVQMSDAPPERPSDMASATMNGRLLPGTGVADLQGLLDALHRSGNDAPVAVEVLNAELVATHPAVDLARLLGDAARRVIDSAMTSRE